MNSHTQQTDLEQNAQPAGSVRIKIRTGQELRLRNNRTGVTETLRGGIETIGVPIVKDGVPRVTFPEYGAEPALSAIKQWWYNDTIDAWKRSPDGEEEDLFND